MTFTPIPDAVRVVHLGVSGGTPIVNTVGAINGSGEVGSDLNDIAQSHGDAWRAHVVPLLHSIYQHQQTLCYSLSDQSAAVGTTAYVSSQAGGGVGTSGPLSNCVVVALKTAKRGRTYQGRMYLSPFQSSAAAADGKTWVPAHVTAVQNIVQAYADAVNPTLGDNGEISIASKGSVLHGIAPHVERVTAFIARSPIATQRRRLT